MSFNPLVDTLPLAVTVGGNDFPVRTDFRTGLKFERLVWDASTPEDDKPYHALQLYYIQYMPEIIAEAYEAILWFYRGGDEDEYEKRQSKGFKTDKNRRVYDVDIDAPLLYTAFLDQYGIDLQTADMHWWTYRTLFAGLSDDHRISKIMGYRAVNTAEIKDKNERARLKKLQALYRLPDRKAAVDKEDMVRRAGMVFG